MMLRSHLQGFSLVELLVSVVVAALLLTGLQRLLGSSIAAADSIEGQMALVRNAHFAMQRVELAVSASNKLLLPLADNPATTYTESVREQTDPPSPPETGSTLASAVLAVTLAFDIDLDADGTFDADNDGDNRFDEDLPGDAQNDGKAGIRDFDDDGNGSKDFIFSPPGDDDESNDLAQSEDWINGFDDDGDGTIDEDPGADNNGDGASGIVGVDDDKDGLIDEEDVDDDDEDGQTDEDWYDPVVFYLQGSSLIERRPVPWDTSGDSSVTGRDFVESTIAENVTRVRFERLPKAFGERQLVDITLEIAGNNGETISLNSVIRVGSWQ